MVISITKLEMHSLRSESFSPPPTEILYPASDEDLSPDEHKAKRRRIEALGQEYLQDRPLLILSAGLRGPLNDGWVNPWAKPPRRRLAAGQTRVIIPAEQSTTAIRSSGQGVPGNKEGSIGITPKAVISVGNQSSTCIAENLLDVAERNKHNTRRYAGKDEDHEHSLAQNLQLADRFESRSLLEAKPAIQSVTSPAARENQISNIETPWLRRDKILARRDSDVSFASASPSPSPTRRSSKEVRSVTLQPQSTTHTLPVTKISEEQLAAFETSNPSASISANAVPLDYGCHRPQNREMQLFSEYMGSNRFGPEVAIKNQCSKPLRVHNAVFDETNTLTFKSFQSRKEVSEDAGLQAENDGCCIPINRLSHEAAFGAPYAVSEDYFRADHHTELSRAEKPIIQRQATTSSSNDCYSRDLTDLDRLTGQIHSANVLPSSKPRVDAFFREEKSAHNSPQILPVPTGLPDFLYCRTARSTSTLIHESLKSQVCGVSDAQGAKILSFSSENTRLGSRSPIREISDIPSTKAGLDISVNEYKVYARQAAAADGNADLNDTGTAAEAESARKQSTSTISSVLPEAQIVLQPVPRYPSTSLPSTDLLETDKQSLKFPSAEEGDSYLQLSTPETLAKAQRSFQKNLRSSVGDKTRSLATELPIKSLQKNEVTVCETAVTPFSIPNSLQLDRRPFASPPACDDEPMSTQEMIDAVTPFAITTNKKPADIKTSCSLSSPTKHKYIAPIFDNARFRNLGLEMEISPEDPPPKAKLASIGAAARGSISKQSSSLPLPSESHSIVFDGTLTEVNAQEGQRPVSDWDLNAVIDEAGSYLGSWDVENEIRKGACFSDAKIVMR